MVVLVPHATTYEKIVSNLEEVQARDGKVIAIATDGRRRRSQTVADEVHPRAGHRPLLRRSSPCCRCSSSRTTSACFEDSTSISRATWPRA